MTDALPPSIETVLLPKTRDLGDGFEVRRLLPAAARRMVGPFVFFDSFGPVRMGGDRAMDVRPHPHIGLATVTYLFQGEILHRDSLGIVQTIRPGDVNWMTAGRGIVHSERTPPELRGVPSTLEGLQLWVGLPAEHEETDPAFVHMGVADLPVEEWEGVCARIIVGHCFGRRSPVPTHSDMFYVDVTMQPGASLEMPREHAERAIYLVSGQLDIDGVSVGTPHSMVVLRNDMDAMLSNPSTDANRLMLLGGAPIGPRFMEWNFVATSRERIDAAKQAWREGRFPQVPGESEFIPLP